MNEDINRLRKAIEDAHKLDNARGVDDSRGLAAERALVEHWLNQGRATEIIVAMDRMHRQLDQGHAAIAARPPGERVQ